MRSFNVESESLACDKLMSYEFVLGRSPELKLQEKLLQRKNLTERAWLKVI